MESIAQRLKTLPRGHWLLINAPIIEHRLTGTTRAGIKKNRTIQIEYKDGTRESVRDTDKFLDRMDADSPDLFKLVRYVQSKRGTS